MPMAGAAADILVYTLPSLDTVYDLNGLERKRSYYEQDLRSQIRKRWTVFFKFPRKQAPQS
jgi:hypothetical protein